MPVVVAVLRESVEGERRVALTPEIAKKLKARGAQVVMEKSAAESAYFPDAAFADALTLTPIYICRPEAEEVYERRHPLSGST